MGNISEESFLQRRCRNSQEAHKKMFGINSHHGNAVQNHNKIPPHIDQGDSNQTD